MVAGFAAFWADSTEPRVRETGLVLELLGLSTVAWGLEKTRRDFGRPSFFANARIWWTERPRLYTRIASLAGHASFGALRASGTADASFAAAADRTHEERIAALESSVQQMQRRLEETRTELINAVSAEREALAIERGVREKGDLEINRALEAAETGGLHVSMMGVVWLAVGLTLSTIPNEILCLWK